MSKPKSAGEALKRCTLCENLQGAHCLLLGEITPESRHLCYMAGYSMQREDKFGWAYGRKLPRRANCE